MQDKLLRMEALIGSDCLDNLKDAKVMICGVGGVGSFVAEALARSGVGKMVLIDYDDIDISNLNRQLETDINNIGKSKVEAMAKRITMISDCEVSFRKEYIDENFSLADDLDYVIDCIDSLNSKLVLAKLAKQKGIRHLASMGAAKRIEAGNIIYCNLDKTFNDPLARRFRELVKKERYQHNIKVVFSDSLPIKTNFGLLQKQKTLGSCIMVTGAIGLKIAEVVLKQLMEVKR